MRARFVPIFLFLACLLLYPIWRPPLGRVLAPRGAAPTSEGSQPEVAQSFIMTGMDLLQTQDGSKALRITARRVLSEDQEQLLELETVRTAFFSDDGGVTFTVTGDRGSYRPRDQELTVSGDVVVTGRENMEVRTDSIRYTVKENLFDAETAATVQGRGITARGEGLRYDATAGTLKMGGGPGRVSTTFRLSPR